MQILDLSDKQHVKNSKHWFEELNQFYHPTGFFGQDSQEAIYRKQNPGSQMILPIALKEWFYLIKKNGYLIIDYKIDKNIDFEKLEKAMWWLWKGKYDIIYHGLALPKDLNSLTPEKLELFITNIKEQELIGPIADNKADKFIRFVCKKTVETKHTKDAIDKWSFGIITKGERNEWVEQMIDSIKAQKIPNYEIIVCGTYSRRKEKNFKIIPFTSRDDKGWITKKKNIIALNSKYENICILHDRILLDKNWYEGIRRYGNCFELLCNQQLLKDTNMRAGDWLTYGNKELDNPYKISSLEYSDWDPYVYMSGQLSILKRFVWEKCHWNETRYWGEEDVEFSYRARDLGYLIRFNRYSYSTALAWRFGIIPAKYKWREGIFPKDMYIRRIMRVIARIFYKSPVFRNFVLKKIGWFFNSKLYRYFLYN